MNRRASAQAFVRERIPQDLESVSTAQLADVLAQLVSAPQGELESIYSEPDSVVRSERLLTVVPPEAPPPFVGVDGKTMVYADDVLIAMLMVVIQRTQPGAVESMFDDFTDRGRLLAFGADSPTETLCKHAFEHR